jgi:hypothetical protein
MKRSGHVCTYAWIQFFVLFCVLRWISK